MQSVPNITAEQIFTTLAATVAFVPVTICTGYLAAWLTDLHSFRRRPMVERLCWSVPLSIALSTIASVLVGRLASLKIAAILILLSALASFAVLLQEYLRLRGSSQKWLIGLRPVGVTILLLTICFIAFEIFSFVDFQSGERLYFSLAFYDIGPRTHWANSVLRTGIPPANPHYFYQHAANLRYYYFWLVDCAVVAKFSRLPMRSIVNAGCIWSGFALTALTGLYLKYFLEVGDRLRRQFYIATLLPAVGGFSLCISFWNMLVLRIPPPGDVWYPGQIADLVSFPLFYPHHLVGMVCCMFAFLLAWISSRDANSFSVSWAANIIFIGMALASAFGISVYTTFAFFLIIVCWSSWQIALHRAWRSSFQLFAGGSISFVLLFPYLREITHSDSKMSGSSPFVLSVRETIPPDRLAHFISASSPAVARAVAKLILLLPGIALELGLYTIVLVVFLRAAWRGRLLPSRAEARLSRAHRTLLFMILVTLPITSFLRSAVISVNDFGIHSALFIQYPLLLLASEILIASKLSQREPTSAAASSANMSLIQPSRFLASVISLAILIGVLGSCYRVVVLRFLLPIADRGAASASNPHVAALPHKAFIANIGYGELNRRIPINAVVQYNPQDDWNFWKNVDYANVNRQTAIAGDGLWCGAELGGDPSGCPAMLADIPPLFRNATAQQALSACRKHSIQYLAVNIYDPVWHNPVSWVWKLNPIVADPEFRALDCR